MTDYRERMSYSAEFDNPRWWRFERDSKIPYGTFDSDWRVSADWWVVAVSVVALVVAIWVSV